MFHQCMQDASGPTSWTANFIRFTYAYSLICFLSRTYLLYAYIYNAESCPCVKPTSLPVFVFFFRSSKQLLQRIRGLAMNPTLTIYIGSCLVRSTIQSKVLVSFCCVTRLCCRATFQPLCLRSDSGVVYFIPCFLLDNPCGAHSVVPEERARAHRTSGRLLSGPAIRPPGGTAGECTLSARSIVSALWRFVLYRFRARQCLLANRSRPCCRKRNRYTRVNRPASTG